MIIGLIMYSFFISSNIENMNSYFRENYRYNKLFDILQKVQDEENQQISDLIMNKINRQLEDNKDRIIGNNIEELRNGLSPNIFKLLQRQMYKDFISKHKLFKILDLDSVSYIAERVSYSTDISVFKINSFAYELIFLCKGRIQILNTYMQLYNEYREGDIVLFD